MPERSSTIAPEMRRTAVLGFVVLLVLLLISTGDLPRFARPEPPAQQIQLSDGWQLASARDVTDEGSAISLEGYRGPNWHDVRRMPATVLQALEADGTYPNLYYGKNLVDEVPQDLWRQDWWYRTTFDAPAGHSTYQLNFPGINYRAEIWLNGHLVADANQIVGMYVDHDVDVTKWIRPGQPNVLAVKVTPERALQDINGVELADSW
ncbi:MAG: glycoside hydrolase, partial [Mycobacterium sp.]|nr:glycoside hydrolase [Mycobacterium sp.]